jgi:hypothetical protein
VNVLLNLQRTHGNVFVQRLVRRKLSVNQPGDRHEQEADRVASQVLSMPDAAAANSMQRAIAPEENKERTLQTKAVAASITQFVQRQMEKDDEGDKPIQAKSAGSPADSLEAGADVETQVSLSKGRGSPLPSPVRAYVEPRFGVDFSSARVHTSSDAIQMNRDLGAQAFTHGSDIYFGTANGPNNLALTAHELTHVMQQTDGVPLQTKSPDVASPTNFRPPVQRTGAARRVSKEAERGSDSNYSPLQRKCAGGRSHELPVVVQHGGAGAPLQRQHVADTGFRYTPPASVKRSIVEIQGIVGTTPDGVYGENTRIAVEKYQTKLKDVGFYSDTLDGKWGNNTDAAHVAFATAPNVERRGYNCAGFAFKDYIFRGLASTKAIYSSMTKLADCSKPCSPYFHKFWFWEYDLKQVDTTTGASSPTHRDFHTVGGQTDRSGKGPDQVMSKNGQRPVEGPKPPLDWKPVTAPTSHPITGLPVPGFETVRTGHIEECFCNDKLP